MKLPILSVLAALSCAFAAHTSTAASSPVVTKTAVPVQAPMLGIASAAQTIYAGALQNNWQFWGWADMSRSNPPAALSSGALKVDAAAWSAVYLHHAPMQTTPSLMFSFSIHGGTVGGQRLVVKALRNGVPQAAYPLPMLRANTWQRYQIPLAKLRVGSVSDLDGFWIQNATGGTLPSFYVDRAAVGPTGTLPPAPPAAPMGLTAEGEWEPNCTECGGMAMADAALHWQAVSGASVYTVYRDGVKVGSPAGPDWTDMSVVSGHTYTYTVTASGPGGESAASASVSATAPFPPAGAEMLTAPVNLAVAGIWTGAPTDTLTWSPVPGAASYNVYQYSTLIGKNVSGTTYTVPTAAWWTGMTYTVTAVDPMGMESLPSAVAEAQGGLDPTQSPVWSPDAPVTPLNLTATPEWNAGRPRVRLTWRGAGADFTYTVYRDGQPLTAGVWGLSSFDTDVKSGETHTYRVSGNNVVWTRSFESAASTPVTATALSGLSSALKGTVTVTDVIPNDDGATIAFAAVPGAVDYRVYDVLKPNTVKYSGGSLSVEMNGLNPAGATLVVEAVDKLGPFQTMDGMAGPGAMQMDGMHSAINGQGDPSNVPNVLAVSAPTPVSCTPFALTGEQAFFDTFRVEKSLVALPCPAPIPGESGNIYGYPSTYSEQGNDKWVIRNYDGDLENTRVFFMGSHFMETLYDGGTAHVTPVMHNNNASLVMMPKATADISGGKVLHVTFEVDAHMEGRRWCDVLIGAAGDTLTDPGKFADFDGRKPTASGRLFRWEVRDQVHSLAVFPGIQPDAKSDAVYLTHQDNGVGPDSFGICARSGPWCDVPWNGTAGDLDKRHTFDLYLSKNRAVIMESGRVVKDAAFPSGVGLPFDQCQVYFVHQLYHTGNDRPELVNEKPEECYWSNYRPFSDERHWDNMGFEVLNSFPALP